MSTTRRPEDVTDEEVERAVKALSTGFRGYHTFTLDFRGYHTFTLDDFRAAIASGLIVPPPRVKTQMEKDEEEVKRRMAMPGNFTPDDGCEFWCILTRLFAAAKAAGVTY